MNCIDRGELTVETMPTDKMLADINTKPLQGKGFRVMRAQLMNVPEDYDDEVKRRCTPTNLLSTGDSTAQLERPISITRPHLVLEIAGVCWTEQWRLRARLPTGVVKLHV